MKYSSFFCVNLNCVFLKGLCVTKGPYVEKKNMCIEHIRGCNRKFSSEKRQIDLPALPFLIFEYEVYSLGSIIYQQAT